MCPIKRHPGITKILQNFPDFKSYSCMVQNMSINQVLIVFIVGFSMDNGRKSPTPPLLLFGYGKTELLSDFEKIL